MIRNISKKIKSSLILSLCCSVIFQNTLLIGYAEQTNIDIESEVSDALTDSLVEENTYEESIDNSEEELETSDIVDDPIVSEDKEENIKEDEESDNYMDPGIANMGADINNISIISANSDAKIVNLSNSNAIGSGKVINADVLNVRSGPSTGYDKLGTLRGNDTVEILGTSGNWYKINFNGREGYVSAAYLALNVLDKGIDVSEWNGDIDWQSVKKSGVSYAIIKAGSRTYRVDPKFHANIQGALNAGIKVGVYWFSYATNTWEAEKEAEKCIETLAPYKDKLTYPVFFDYEYASVDEATKQGITITKDIATNIAKTFLNKVKSNGYLTGLYTNTDFSNRYFQDELLYSNHIWHAQYNTVNTFKKPYSMWQYSDKGSVPGIKGAVDLNYTTLRTFDIGDSSSNEIGITKTNLNLTVGPFSNATVVCSINKNNSVEILDKGISGWYYVQYNGKRGYLPSQYISKNEIGTATANLNLTVGPFSNATVISSVNRGASVEILDKGISGWYYVQYNGKRGYLPSQYVNIYRSEVGITTSNLNLTVGPFSNATVISSIKNSSVVEILDKGIYGWYYVQYNGNRGYLPSQYVSQSEIGVTNNSINLTVGPFYSATVISSIKYGATVEILDKGISGWYYVQYNGQRGYIPTAYIN